MRSPSGCLVKYIISNIPEMSNLPSPPGQNERIDIMASIRKRGNSYQITVSCGRDTQDRKITRTVTYRPELCTPKGHLKSERSCHICCRLRKKGNHWSIYRGWKPDFWKIFKEIFDGICWTISGAKDARRNSAFHRPICAWFWLYDIGQLKSTLFTGVR